MLTDATIESKVVLYHFGEIIGKATIKGQTACYWQLSNDQRVKKELGYYWENHNKSKRIDVKVWSKEIEALYQAHTAAKQIESALAAQKIKLESYLQYMRSGYFSRMSSDQIANILAACQEQIGDISTPRIR